MKLTLGDGYHDKVFKQTGMTLKRLREMTPHDFVKSYAGKMDGIAVLEGKTDRTLCHLNGDVWNHDALLYEEGDLLFKHVQRMSIAESDDETEHCVKNEDEAVQLLSSFLTQGHGCHAGATLDAFLHRLVRAGRFERADFPMNVYGLLEATVGP